MKVPDHRDRLREKYQNCGEAALDDFDILELLLFHATPERNTKMLATGLLERFGTLAGVFSAPVALLQEVNGVSKAIALELKFIGIAGQRMLKNEMRSKKVFSSSSTVIDYCRAAMAYEPRAVARAIPEQAQYADRRRSTGTWHCRSRAGLSARSDAAGARTFGNRRHPRPQSPER
ncbi:DNA repair protein RadC [Neorhizobium sp. 2083]|nr:DNA repair protein RadC [Neorhizobium sp. 2083]